MPTITEYIYIEHKLGELKTRLAEIMEEIRACDDVGKIFKKLVKEKQKLEKDIRALNYQMTEGQSK